MKKDFKNKTIALLLSCAMILSCVPTTVFAESANVDSTGSVETDFGDNSTTNKGKDITQGEDAANPKVSETEEKSNTDTTSTVNVYATIASTYTVHIPKTVILDANTGIGIYKIEANGDIAGDETLTIAPPATNQFTLTSGEGKGTTTATISQTNTAWQYTDLANGILETGTITADIEAGTWSGSFNFNIKCGFVPVMMYADESYNKSEDSGVMKFRSNAPYNTFSGVKIDGELIDESNYTTSEGSTIVELNEDYVKSLDFGWHKIEIVSGEDSVNADFTINQNVYMKSWYSNTSVPWYSTYSSTLTSYGFVKYEDVQQKE